MCGNYYSSGCGRGYYYYSGCGEDYGSSCGRGLTGGGITVVAKEDFDNILKDAEKTINDVCNKADVRKKWLEGLCIENKNINKDTDKSMCGNFCDLTEKCIIKNSECGSLNNPNVRPGPNYEWIATCGGGGRWQEVSPDNEYWENYKKQYDKDPKSMAVVIGKEDFNKLMKEAEETVNNISFKSDNVINDEHKKYEEYCKLSQKRSMETTDDLKTCENEGCKFCQFGPKMCIRFEQGDLMLGPQKCKHWQNKYSGEEYDKTPRTITIGEFMAATNDADKELEKLESMKKAERETIEKVNEGSANVIRRTYEKLAKGVGWDEPYETYLDRVSGKKTDLTKEQKDKLHNEELNSELFKSIVAKFVGIADMNPNTFIDGYLMSGGEQIKAEIGQFCAYEGKIYKLVPGLTAGHYQWKDDTANIYFRTITVDDIVDAWMIEQCKDCNREKHCSDCRVYKVYNKDTEEGEDTSYKHMTDEEMLELLKKDTIDNIMTKLSGQVIDLVDDAMRTAIVDFERAKKVRDTYEDRINWSTELKPESKVEPDFMEQWTNEMMEKQAKQTNISVVNEMLHQKTGFVKFLKECLKLDTYSDFMYKIENEIKSQENEINFYENYLKENYKN